jgi:hypothetical protein
MQQYGIALSRGLITAQLYKPPATYFISFEEGLITLVMHFCVLS